YKRQPLPLPQAHAADGIEWRKCPSVERLPSPVECGTVSVPVDHAKPDGERIDLTVSRIRATGEPGERRGSLLYNPGGPGGNGMLFPLYPRALGGVWKRLNTRYDLVGYAPRGVGRSAPLSCQDPLEFVQGPNRSPRRPSPAYKEERKAQAAAYARGCAQAQGTERLRHYTTPDNARDLDAIRAALGERKLNFLGVSYGTYIGAVYATLFPERVRRLVLDSVVDPSPGKIWYRSNLDQNPAFERRWGDWKAWAARHHGTYGLGSTPRQVQRAFDEVRDAVDRKPAGGTVGSRELLESYFDVAYADSTWDRHARALAAFRDGDPEPLAALAAPGGESGAGDGAADAADAENGNAVYNAVQCADAPWPRDWARWDADNSAMAPFAPFLTWENAWMNLPCAHWKAPSSRPLDVRTEPGTPPSVLLLAATRDAATPYEGALEAQRRLSGASLVTERGAGNHGVAGGNECVDAHLERYLLQGKTPGDHADCAARSAPQPESGPARQEQVRGKGRG
ncbi:alpha/beta hydrolase, partial [Streptomyces boncukensis]